LRLRTLPRLVVLVVASGLLLAGCARNRAGEPAAARQAEAGVQARAQVLIEEGNAFYRVKDYTNAAKRYGAAAVVKPDDPAAYFGLGMALTRLGRYDDARTAYARAHELAQRARDSAAAGR